MGVVNGPGAIYECGCSDIPEGDCDCNGNVLDECGVCGGSGIAEGECDCDGNVLDACGVAVELVFSVVPMKLQATTTPSLARTTALCTPPRSTWT